MKKLFTLVLLFCSLQSFAQLTLVNEKEFKDWKTIILSNGLIKLYTTKISNNKIQSIEIYNNDLSLYKSINILQNFPYDTIGHTETFITLKPVKDISNYLYYFTDNLFNQDDKLEFIISYYSKKTTNGLAKHNNVIIITNQDGKEIQRFTNLESVNESSSLYLYNNLFVTLNNITKIYSVPGNLPCPFTCSQKAAGIAPITQPNEFKEIQVTGFPNPSSEKVTLAYSLPEGTPFGTLRLYTQTGELVKEFKVSNQVDHLELPVSEYNSGTYFYELQAGGSSSGGKKMVVIH